MSKAALADSLDGLQTHLDPLLGQAGFRKHGRTYSRITTDGLTHFIGFQMGRFDPPGTTDIPGLKENLYGRFTVNLGVYVPEVARNHGGGGEAKRGAIFGFGSNTVLRTSRQQIAHATSWSNSFQITFESRAHLV